MDIEFLTFICGCYFGVSLCIPVLIIACKHKKHRRLRKTGRSAESLIPVDAGKSMLLRPSRRGGANSVRTKPSPTTTPTAEKEKEAAKKDTTATTPEKKASESKEKDKDKDKTNTQDKEKTTQTKTTDAKNSKDTDKKKEKKPSDSKLDKTQKSSNGAPSVNIQPTQASIDNTQSPTEQESMD